jgi:UDP-glucose 4-epimerase
MECVLTGARGFVGRGLLPILAASGHTGIATGRIAPTDLPHGWRGATRHEMLATMPGPPPDAVIHLEVEQAPSRASASDSGSIDRVNVGATRAWLDWAARHGVRRFVFTSSIMATLPTSGPGAEDDPLEKGATYGGSKARAEAEVRAWAEADANRLAVILRPAPVYGPDDRSNLLAFARRVISGRPVFLGRGDVRRSFVSRRNLAAAIAFALDLPVAGSAVFQVSDPRTMTLAETAALIAELTGAPRPRGIPLAVARIAAPLGDLVGQVTGRCMPLSSARLQALREPSDFPSDRLVAMGFVHPQSSREGLAEMLDWMAGEPARVREVSPTPDG